MAAEGSAEPGDTQGAPPQQRPCPLCGKSKELVKTINSVGLHVLRLLSKGIKATVDGLLKQRGLLLPEPKEASSSVRPLSVRCCHGCYCATSKAKERARGELSWLPHLDDSLFPGSHTRLNGERVQAYQAPNDDQSFVFQADGSTAVSFQSCPPCKRSQSSLRPIMPLTLCSPLLFRGSCLTSSTRVACRSPPRHWESETTPSRKETASTSPPSRHLD